MLFIMLLGCANVGLPSGLFYRKPCYLEGAFWLGLAFTGVQGLLAVPSTDYLLGYMSFPVFYGVLSIDSAHAHGALPSRPNTLAQLIITALSVHARHSIPQT